MTYSRQEDYYSSVAEVSLLAKGINNPSPEQLRIETLFQTNKAPRNTTYIVTLSEREISCLLLAAWGVDIKETASLLNVTEDKVNKCRAEIADKFNAKNIYNAIFIAQQAGFLTIDNVDFILKLKHKKTNLSQINKEFLRGEYAPI
ncbi:helix-turn-helix transcriptional regulator [Rickettsiella endosymbiont of Dermanyssus gallinae]|uniref:helix-turn-helix transcriptional regulator n=1 Tax=Rickettsiella endosymbiont of Dermanyssus gallinae TaxID=2856608 RepID=UPI001C52FCC0|nr:LuxR C-terminal-related transcriptional regulator [Rickettsiella endosymbiont of Dermanyssus gallinae]